jgi:hypothetical protein
MRLIGFNREPEEGLYVPHKVDKWYNRSQKSWVVQLLDKYGNQIGEASYVGSKEEAVKEVEYLIKEHGL